MALSRHSLQVILRAVHGCCVLVFSIIAGIYIVRHSAEFSSVSAGSVSFLESTYFLVILLNFFFLLIYNMQHSPSVGALLSLIFGPILSCVVQYLLAGTSAGFFFAQIGMTYVIELTVAFSILVGLIAGIVLFESIRDRTFTDIWVLLMPAAQGIFIIPGIGASLIFVKMIFIDVLPRSIPHYQPYSLIALLVYAGWGIPVIQNVIAFFWDFKKESVL